MNINEPFDVNFEWTRNCLFANHSVKINVFDDAVITIFTNGFSETKLIHRRQTSNIRGTLVGN